MNDNELTVAQIDKELERLSDRSCQLKSIRNSRAVISQIPSELLLNILLEYKHQVELAYRTSQSHDPRAYTYDWISVTHVCHHWRQLLLDSPSFWTTIYLRTPRIPPSWVDQLLIRAKNATISVLDLQIPLRHGDEFLDVSLAYFLFKELEGTMRPIQRLRLWLNDPYKLSDDSLLRSLASSIDLSNLEELSIMDSTSCKTGTQLFSLFFSGRPSQLQSLTLKGGFWETTTSPELDIDWNTFCRILASFNHLKHLELDWVLQSLESSPNKDPIQISFPNLQSLTLQSDGMRAYAQFLQSVSFSPAARIAIIANMCRSDEDMIALLSVLCRVYSNGLNTRSSSELQGCELRISQSYPAHPLIITLDPSSSITQNPYIRIHCRGFRPYLIPSDYLLRRIANHMQPLIASGFHYAGFLFESDELSKHIINAFSHSPGVHTFHIDSNVSEATSFVTALSSFTPTCSCLTFTFPDSEDDSDQVPTTDWVSGSMCQSCKAFMKAYFPDLRTIIYRGRGVRPSIDDVQNLKKLLVYFRDAGRPVQTVEFRGLRFVPTREFDTLCKTVKTFAL